MSDMAATLAPARPRLAARVDPALVALGALTLTGAVLRVATLGTQSYWMDEATTAGMMPLSFGDMLSGVHAHESTPPLYYALAWLWTRAFGRAEVGLRSLSALAGTATIPVAFAAARELAGRRAAVVTAALIAFSPPLLWYSQEARAYQLVVLLCACSLLFFARARARNHPSDLAAWAVASALALWTHYFAAFVVVPEAVLLLVPHAGRRRVVFATAGIVTAAAPLVPLVLNQRGNLAIQWIASASLTGRLKAVSLLFAVGPESKLHVNVVLVATAALLALALARVLTLPGSRTRTGALVALAVGLGGFILVGVAKLAGSDFFDERNALPVWLPLVVFIAAGVAALPRPAALALVTAICGVYLALDVRTASDVQRQRDDWRSVAEVLGPVRAPRMVVLTPYWQVPGLQYYEPGFARMETMQPVSEIDTIDEWSAAPRDIPPLPPPGPPFRPVSTVTVQHFTIARFRVPKPVLVTPVAFDPHRVPSLDYYQRPR